MSLIEEALRRVKDPLMPTTSAKPQPAPNAPSPRASPVVHSWSATGTPALPQSGGSPASPVTLVMLAVGGFTLALLVGGAVWMWNLYGNRLSVTITPTPSETAADSRQEPAAPRSAKVPTENRSDFSLAGIVEGLGEPYAMINGSIVAEGETIGEATLLTIAEGTVTLRLADGKETILRVER